VWHRVGEFWLKAQSAGLGHDAVIEIMIALLGVMIAVLTLLSALITIFFAVLGFWGYQTIRDDAKKMAAAAAREVAESVAAKVMADISEKAQASGMSEGQAEDMRATTPRHQPSGSRKRKATTDKGLKS